MHNVIQIFLKYICVHVVYMYLKWFIFKCFEWLGLADNAEYWLLRFFLCTLLLCILQIIYTEHVLVQKK